MKEIIACPKCGTEFTFETTPVSETAERILDLSIFRTDCPSCGAGLMLPHPSIYHNQEKQFIIRFIPHDFNISDLPVDSPVPKEGYLLRTVRTPHSFREKVLILENGLDDRAIELLKILTIQQNPERFDLSDPDVLLLADADNEALSFFALAKDGKDFMLKTPIGLYHQMCAELASLPAAESQEYEIVDSQWVLERFRRVEE